MFAERHKQCLKDMLEAECGSHLRTEKAGAGRPLQEQGRLKIYMSKKKIKGMEGGMKKKGREEEKRGGKKLHLSTTSLHY